MFFFTTKIVVYYSCKLTKILLKKQKLFKIRPKIIKNFEEHVLTIHIN